MKTFTIEQARAATSSGGVLSVNLKPIGSMFALEFVTHNGPAMLIAAVSKQVRRFSNPIKAFEIVRELGLEGGHFSVAEWHPEEKALDRPTRPDKAAALKAAHQAAGLKHLLDERVNLANAPDAIWHEAEDVFAELEIRNAN
ncbi:hypothetical protein [Solimicrobium silvestre]|uniref:Uncharacterized protein n=1 Tax=Solimicrobium silvestre TaxID=2099400 RepID=A0A2S9GXH2_9BURK|nr:hypothetical protein [Solimicrobium silvestre]PRC92408.1 hypothetical protein S2091_2783 [Solimicrobium silvestre]